MMQRNTINFEGQSIFIGIDVHLKSWEVTILTETGCKETYSQNPSAHELRLHLDKRYPKGSYIAVYESGFTGFSTYYALEAEGIKCYIANASDVPTTQYEQVMKTDHIDSKKLAKSLRNGDIKGIYIMPREALDDRSLLRSRSAIKTELGRNKNRVLHILHTNGVEIPERFMKSNRWTRAFITWLMRDVKLLSATRNTLDLLVEQVELGRGLLLKVTKKLRELSESERYSKSFELLRSIPGYGLITCMTILLEIYDFNRFGSEGEFASYLGLVPTSHSSGEKDIHGKKTFRGNKKIGPVLIEASWRAIALDPGLGALYSRYKKRMTPQKAIVRIARKLSNITLSVMKTGKPYESYHSRIAENNDVTGGNSVTNVNQKETKTTVSE